MACNCTKKTAIKYIDELCEKGFILKERNGNRKTNSYYLMDIDKIDHLHVSEMFWRTVNSVYKEVEVCLYEDVYECFIKMLEKLDKEGIIFREIPVDAETESHIRETLLSRVKKEGDDMFNPPTCESCVVKDWCKLRSGEVKLPPEHTLTYCVGYDKLEKAIGLAKIPKEYRTANLHNYVEDADNADFATILKDLLSNSVGFVTSVKIYLLSSYL
ncbi:hypothetical protein G195_000008 [Phytophthora kernoviae 00238/432]|uniref:Uncharacterized protein n=1 Tax=Phytophthora kernoviae 00238/432 TaxID=1284355 RepID=A0A8J4WBT0_9STRA|nr:hypothetical protein G195_000008 [Phytophthora kernoviae 00238/432]